MNRRSVLILLIFLLFGRIFGQTETNYLGTLIATGPVNNIPIVSEGPFPIGFNFTFFGNAYSQFYINGNGLVMFTAPTATFSTEATIPTAAVPNNYIAPFWDDLVVDGTGHILYTTVGASPNRKLIVQFKNMGFYPFPVFFGTFSVILYETTNVIQVQYRLIVDYSSTKAHGESATIGIENSDGSAGVLYKYHDPAAITTKQAISFTPSGPTYTVNSSADYEWVYLTTNLSQPAPGIPNLVGPPQDAIIGSNYTFEWEAAAYATNYSLKISNYSDLTDAVSYDAGTNLTYDITGLLLDTSYYWGVFASNATGITWCEIKKFYTSSTPPLIGVPREVWVPLGEEREVKLQYTGGDASVKTATVTSLPLQGHLYQVSGGVKSVLITSAPTVVSDPQYSLIYVADGGTGNGAGNFNFKFHDGTGDSPEATITINVNPAGVPNFLNAARNANVEVQFDIPMNDPSGKQNQFAVTVNGLPATINSASLKTDDPYTFVLTLATPLTGSETVLVSYTKGTVSATTGGLLESFTDQPVTLLAQTITFSTNLSKKYNDPPFNLSASASSGLPITFSSSNLVVATISGTTLTIHTVGTSDITARQAGNSTYAPARYIKTLTVSKGDQTITFGVLPAKTYGDADFVLSATASSGLSVSFASNNPSVATVAGTTVHIVGAGTSTITASQAGNTLWNPAPDVPQTLTVNKADQTITFSSLPAKTYGDADFSGGATVSSGLTVSYSSDNLSVATIISGMIRITGAGTAVITTSQAGDANYNSATDVLQSLTVNKADLTFTADNKTKDYMADIPELTYTVSGYVNSENESVLDLLPSIQTTALQDSPAGDYPITLSGGSDNNYNYLYVEGILTITLTSHKNIMYLFTPNNDSFNDLWELPEMSTWGNCDVKVYNRWGKLVYDNKNYNNTWDGTSGGKPVPEGAYYFVIKTENSGVVKGTVNIVR